jgi:hypothetical protein
MCSERRLGAAAHWRAGAEAEMIWSNFVTATSFSKFSLFSSLFSSYLFSKQLFELSRSSFFNLVGESRPIACALPNP